jgi:hypothetical protein
VAYKNIEDQRAASKRHYYANKQKYIEKKNQYKEALRAKVREIKESNPCSDCGVGYPYFVMDFDHLEQKEGMISYYAKTGRSGALKRELEKCEVVCANCHRARTHKRLQSKPA